MFRDFSEFVNENEKKNKNKEWYADGLTDSIYDNGKYWHYLFSSANGAHYTPGSGGDSKEKNKYKFHPIIVNPKKSTVDTTLNGPSDMENRKRYNFKFHVLGDIIEQPAISSMKDLIGKAVLIKNEMNQNYYITPEYSNNTKHYPKSILKDWSSCYKYMIWFIDKSPLGDGYYTIKSHPAFLPNGAGRPHHGNQKAKYFADFHENMFDRVFRTDASGEPGKELADLKGTRESRREARASFRIKDEWKVGTSTSTTYTTKMQVYYRNHLLFDNNINRVEDGSKTGKKIDLEEIYKNYIGERPKSEQYFYYVGLHTYKSDKYYDYRRFTNYFLTAEARKNSKKTVDKGMHILIMLTLRALFGIHYTLIMIDGMMLKQKKQYIGHLS